MPRIRTVATAVPETRVDQDLAQAFAAELFTGRIPDLDRLLAMFAATGIDTRHFAAPVDWFISPTTWPRRAPCTHGRPRGCRPRPRAAPWPTRTWAPATWTT